MDVLEIFSQIRNIKGVQIEDEIPTRPLLRAINLGFRTLCKQIKECTCNSLPTIQQRRICMEQPQEYLCKAD